MNFFKFPYDKQTCKIIIGSWQHDSKRIDFDLDDSTIDYADTLKNNIWTLKSVVISEELSRKRFDVNSNATDVAFALTMHRNSINFMVNNIFPTLVISCVTLLTFFFNYAQQVVISKHLNRNFFVMGYYLKYEPHSRGSGSLVKK